MKKIEKKIEKAYIPMLYYCMQQLKIEDITKTIEKGWLEQ